MGDLKRLHFLSWESLNPIIKEPKGKYFLGPLGSNLDSFFLQELSLPCELEKAIPISVSFSAFHIFIMTKFSYSDSLYTKCMSH